MGDFERLVYDGLLVGGLAVAGFVFVVLFFVDAPYGRFSRSGWGPVIPARAGWVLMESVSLGVFVSCVWVGGPVWSAGLGVLVLAWVVHYGYRAFVYPFRMRERGKTMPVLIFGFAILFNSMNGFLNGRYLGVGSAQYGAEWLSDPRFLIGMIIFVVGFGINHHADGVLFRLRGPGESGYKIPRGGLYRWVSCPNYFGEMVEWIGFGIAVWSWAGAYFAIWTAANLIPRAVAHHRWYRDTFEEYPMERRAVFPFLL